MLHVIERAVDFYQNRKLIWNTLVKRGMEGDYSWDHSAGDYLKLYRKLFAPDEEAVETECEKNPVVVDIQ